MPDYSAPCSPVHATLPMSLNVLAASAILLEATKDLGESNILSRCCSPARHVPDVCAKEPVAADVGIPPPATPPGTAANTGLIAVAIILYSFSGMGIIFANKATLTVYRFPSPSFLAFLQLAFTVLLISGLKLLKKVEFEDVSWDSCRRVMPMPALFFGNAVCGLCGSKAVSIPTATALRKVSMLFIMVLEQYMFGKKQSWTVKFAVLLMIGGAMVAAMRDLDFSLAGYLYIMLNNAFTASHFAYTKQKADVEAFGAVGSLYYCALLSLPMSFLFMLPDVPRVLQFDNWANPEFLVLFLLSTVLGCLVTFTTILLTKVSSGLTTSVVGCLRNIVPVYLGMLHVFEYTFDHVNFVGHTISVGGAILYSAAKVMQ